MVRSKTGTKKISPDDLPHNNNNIHNMQIFYMNWKKYNEIQLTKNKMDLNNRKLEKSSTLLANIDRLYIRGQIFETSYELRSS